MSRRFVMDTKSDLTMINISGKPDMIRIAKAEGSIRLKSKTLQAIEDKEIKKGDVFTAAKLAAINAVKKTSELIFLAHPIPITEVKVTLSIDKRRSSVKLVTEVQSIGKTGVELEALTGVAIGLLSVFDMCKYLEKDEKGQYGVTSISDIKVIKKVKENPAKT